MSRIVPDVEKTLRIANVPEFNKIKKTIMIDFKQSPADLMTILEKFKVPQEKINAGIAQYDVKKHEIFENTTKFADKIVEVDGVTSTVPINRIGIAYQKLIVDKSVAFGFANPVTYKFTDEDKADSLKKMLKKLKVNSLTRSVAREVYSTSHSAEVYYTVENLEKSENEPDKFKLRCLHLKASKGDVFYPVFDKGDMVAFVRQLKKPNEAGEEKDYAEIYTAESKMTFINDGGWKESEEFPIEKNVIGKIPVAYVSQDDVEWADVQTTIERVEALVSGHAEVNDYHFAPKLKSKGVITGFAKKGEKGAIFEMEPNADLEYLTWNQGTASLELEYNTLDSMIYKLTQTPDISFSEMQGFGTVSGVAWQYFFMDAHLKVEMKKEIWEDFLTRRINIIKSFISELIDTSQKSALEEIDVDIQINPYIINDIASRIAEVKQGTTKDVVSQRTAVKMLGLVDDVEKEIAFINSDSAELEDKK